MIRLLLLLIFSCISHGIYAQCNTVFTNSCAAGNYIDSVYILGKPISNTSTCSSTLPNNLTTYMDTVCWTKGFTYWAAIRTSSPNMHVAVFADFNGDNNFNGAGEQVANIFSATTAHFCNIPIMATALIGVHKLRIITSPNSITGPCDTLTSGEVEEYFFSIVQPNPYPVNCKCPSSFNTINDTACNSKLSPGGNQLWKMSGFYSDTLTNSIGCDSFLHINLIIHPLNDSIEYANNGLQAQAIGKNYQWYDCSTQQIIVGATNRFYTPTNVGLHNLACIISDSNCIDTSGCLTFIIGATSDFISEKISLQPNPANNQVQIISPYSITAAIKIYNLQGQLVMEQKALHEKRIHLQIDEIMPGVYLIEIPTSKGTAQKKLVVQR